MKIAIVLESLGDSFLFGREELWDFHRLACLNGHVVDTFNLGIIGTKGGDFKVQHVGELVKEYDWCLVSFHVNPHTQSFFREVKKGKVKVAQFSHDLMTTSWDVISADNMVPEIIFVQTLLQLNFPCPQIFKDNSKIVPIPSLKLSFYESDLLLKRLRCNNTEIKKQGCDRNPKLVSIVMNMQIGSPKLSFHGKDHVDCRVIKKVLEDGGYEVKFKGIIVPAFIEDSLTEFHGLIGTAECVSKSAFVISEGSAVLADAVYGGSIPILMVKSYDKLKPVVNVVGRDGDIDIIDHVEEGGYPNYVVRKPLPVAHIIGHTDEIGEPLLEKLKHLSEHYDENVKILQESWCIKSNDSACVIMLREIEEYK